MPSLSQLLQKQANVTARAMPPPPGSIINATLHLDDGVAEDDRPADAAVGEPAGGVPDTEELDRTVAQCRRKLKTCLAAAISNGIMSAMLTHTVSLVYDSYTKS